MSAIGSIVYPHLIDYKEPHPIGMDIFRALVPHAHRLLEDQVHVCPWLARETSCFAHTFFGLLTPPGPEGERG